MDVGANDYRQFLSEKIAAKSRNGRNFSLRAAARLFEIAPSNLSSILNGKRHLTIEGATRIAEKLGLSPAEANRFFTMLNYSRAKNEKSKQIFLKKLEALGSSNTPEFLDVDMFEIIATWYHLPILECFELDNFSPNAQSISSLLNLPYLEVVSALERLLRLNLLVKTKDSGLQKNQKNPHFKSVTKNSALQKFHTQMLSKAIHSISHQDPGNKIVTTRTFAFNRITLNKARALAEEFMNSLVTLAEESKQRNRIYHADFVLFDLSKESLK